MTSCDGDDVGAVLEEQANRVRRWFVALLGNRAHERHRLLFTDAPHDAALHVRAKEPRADWVLELVFGPFETLAHCRSFRDTWHHVVHAGNATLHSGGCETARNEGVDSLDLGHARLPALYK